MKVKTAFRIQRVLQYLIVLLFLPIGLIGIVFDKLTQFFSWVISKRDDLLFYVGHTLFLKCEESNVVKNPDYFKHFTAGALYAYLKENNEKELK